ncbi:hypothetical protein HDV00_009571 [Rhizophlyctis rosea]|nr:hypothetical protein HDV00_009571 [Rhizophlyctis rosea]
MRTVQVSFRSVPWSTSSSTYTVSNLTGSETVSQFVNRLRAVLADEAAASAAKLFTPTSTKPFISETATLLSTAYIPLAIPTCTSAKPADPTRTIEYYDIFNEGEVTWHGQIHFPKVLTVTVQTLTGKQIPTPICTSATLLDLKEEIEAREGIPPRSQRMVYRGIVLRDDKRALVSYGIYDDRKVHLVLSLRGGTPPASGRFVDLASGKGSETTEWNDDAPRWRMVLPGLAVEGYCRNKKCAAGRNNDLIVSARSAKNNSHPISAVSVTAATSFTVFNLPARLPDHLKGQNPTG